MNTSPPDRDPARNNAGDLRSPRRRSLLAVIAALAGLGLAFALTQAQIGDDLVTAALAPIGVVADDGAGDDYAPGDRELPLPLPSALEDDRVLAALAPIAELSCNRDDPRYARTDRAPRASGRSANEVLAQGNLLAAGLAPIALLPDGDDPEATPAIAPMATAIPRATGDARAAIAAPAADGVTQVAAAATSCPALLDHRFNRLQTGEPQSLCQFQGKVLLVVNTASYCGYTNQYEGLEAMYRKYRDRGLVVVGFPSNDFGSQEPGSNKEIAEFCRSTYGVQFPMFEKGSVGRLATHPLYAELSAKTGAVPKWNFHKYVIDRSGTRVASFASEVTPEARPLVELIERLLAEPAGTAKG